MKTTYIEGENRCYVCNYLIEWHHSFPTSISRMEVHKLTGVDTDIIAVDKKTILCGTSVIIVPTIITVVGIFCP